MGKIGKQEASRIAALVNYAELELRRSPYPLRLGGQSRPAKGLVTLDIYLDLEHAQDLRFPLRLRITPGDSRLGSFKRYQFMDGVMEGKILDGATLYIWLFNELLSLALAPIMMRDATVDRCDGAGPVPTGDKGQYFWPARDLANWQPIAEDGDGD